MARIEQSLPDDHRPAAVLYVDDQPWVLALLRDVLRASNELEPLAEADTGERAIKLTEELHPDIVLMDVHLPGIGGIRAAELIKTRFPSTLVVLISATHPDELPGRADECGADMIVWKNDLDPVLLDEIWVRYRN